MPADWLTTIGVTLATAAAVAALVMAVGRLRAGRAPVRVAERWLVWLVCGLCAATLAYRAAWVTGQWQPLASHIDGTLLLMALLAAVVGYLQAVGRLRGIDAFALPLLVVLGLWGVCASWWTFRPFDVARFWGGLHIIAAYLGAAAVAVAAAAAGMYLYVQRQLRRRDTRGQAFRRLAGLASLEAIEQTMTAAATVGFVLITIVMILGTIDAVTADVPTAFRRPAVAWPKLLGTIVAWGLLAAVVHIRFAPRLRGSHAAALTLAGFVVVLIVLALTLASH